jgi:hypothetical protein
MRPLVCAFLVGVTLVIGTGTLEASGTPAATCAAKKQQAAGEKVAGKLRCYAAAAQRNVPVDASCLAHVESKFSNAMATAEARGGCLSPGDASTVEAEVDACVGNLVSLEPPSTTSTVPTTSSTSTSTTTTTTVPSSCSGLPGQLGSFGGSGDGQYLTPSGVATDGSGNIYVADTGGGAAGGNFRVLKFDKSGTFLLTFGWGVADGKAAFEVCSSGCRAGIGGSGNGQFSGGLAGVAADGSGNVYVADFDNSRVQKFDASGNFLTILGNGHLQAGNAVATDGSGNVYVPVSDGIQKFDASGNFLTILGNGQVAGGAGIAVDGSGNIYVVDNNRIQKFDASGTFLTMWGSLGVDFGQFDSPTGIATDRSGNVYVADFGNSRVQKFDASGVFLTEPAYVPNPLGVAIDGSGHGYATGGVTGVYGIQPFCS